MSTNTLITVQFSRNAQLLRSNSYSLIGNRHLLNIDCELDTMLGIREMKKAIAGPLDLKRLWSSKEDKDGIPWASCMVRERRLMRYK